MNILKSGYAWLGRMAFWLGLPFWRIYLRQSHRVYVLFTHNGEILMIKSWLNNGVWHLPGGGVQKQESQDVAIRREVIEELGFDLGSIKLSLLTSGIWQTNRLASHYQILTGELTERPNLKLKRPEILQAEWLKPAQLTTHNVPDEILQAVRRLKL